MASVKTAISIQKSLFEQVETLARELKVSRSHLFVMALENFVRDYRNKQLFDRINAAYENTPPDKDERQPLRYARRQQRRMVEDEW